MRKISKKSKNKYFLAVLVLSLFTGIGYASLERKLGMQLDVSVLKYEKPFSLYSRIADGAVLDNISSTYVTSDTGIDFSQKSSDTNGKGVYTLNYCK